MTKKPKAPLCQILIPAPWQRRIPKLNKQEASWRAHQAQQFERSLQETPSEGVEFDFFEFEEDLDQSSS